jgi:hypothetical protein
VCSSVDFGYDSIIHETVHVQSSGPTCVEIQGVEMLTLIGGLCVKEKKIEKRKRNYNSKE